MIDMSRTNKIIRRSLENTERNATQNVEITEPSDLIDHLDIFLNNEYLTSKDFEREIQNLSKEETSTQKIQEAKETLKDYRNCLKEMSQYRNATTSNNALTDSFIQFQCEVIEKADINKILQSSLNNIYKRLKSISSIFLTFEQFQKAGRQKIYRECN